MAINCATEASDSNFHLTRTSIYSFINNNPWFEGDIILLTHKDLPLSDKNIRLLQIIYPNIKKLDLTGHSIFESIKSQFGKINYVTHVNQLLKWASFSQFNEKTLYFSNFSLFTKNISDFLDSENLVKCNKSPYLIYFSKKIDASLLYLENSDKIYSTDHIDQILNLKFDSLFSPKFSFENYTIFSSSIQDAKYTSKQGEISTSKVIFYKNLSNSKNNSKINHIWLYQNKLVSDSFESPKKIIESPLVELEAIPISTKIDFSKFKISYIIPAYKTHQYIEKCLDSISNQTLNIEHEIIIGVDNCELTLNKLLEIKKKYSNIRIFKSNKSVGPYILRNSLVEFSKYPYLFFFDSDDILSNTAVEIIFNNYIDNRILRFKYINFKNEEKYLLSTDYNSTVAHGVFFISSELFKKTGGFQGWVCAADTEFIKRCDKNRILTQSLNTYLFYRRIHDSSLTQSSSTNHRSKIRSIYRNWIKFNKNWNIPINKKTISLNIV